MSCNTFAGPQLEAAWRRRHKWAAQKAGGVLTDSYSSPPLKPFLSAAQKLSIGMLLLVRNPAGFHQPLSEANQTAGVASSWSAPGQDSSWLLSLSYPISNALRSVHDLGLDQVFYNLS